MKLSNNPFIHAGARLITSAALVATLFLAPGMTFAADKEAHENHTEVRIKDLHEKLKITPEQEDLWSKVAQVMLDEAKNMDALAQTRFEHAKTLTAIDDLKSYGEIADAHAAGIKKLTPVFTDLYNALSDSQKQEADILFREGVNKHKKGHHKSADK